jgi:hypothetical protein
VYCSILLRNTSVIVALLAAGAEGFGQEISGGHNLTDVRQYLKHPGRGGRDTVSAGMTCGVDCLYLMLLVQGKDCLFSDLEEAVSIGNHGASLLDLQRAADRFGLSSVAVRCATDKLQTLPLPAIAHLEGAGQSGAYNHYVLLLDVTPSALTLFDPLDNRLHLIPREKLGEHFSGYFLVPRVEVFGLGTTMAWCVSVCLVIGLGVWWFCLSPKQKGRGASCLT